jgi:hypothetical protein
LPSLTSGRRSSIPAGYAGSVALAQPRNRHWRFTVRFTASVSALRPHRRPTEPVSGAVRFVNACSMADTPQAPTPPWPRHRVTGARLKNFGGRLDAIVANAKMTRARR